MTLTQIYNLFKTMTDDEEFASDSDFIASMNLADRTLRGERHWEALKKTANIATTDLVLSTSISDFDMPLKVWAVVGSLIRDKYPISKVAWGSRYDDNGDYTYNSASQTLEILHDTMPTNWQSFQVDYKYRPEAFAELTESPTWLPEEYHAIYAYELVRIFKRADADFDFYSEYGTEYEYIRSLIQSWNETLADR